ncbi:hypothetical protein ACFXJ5_13970 [Streptomyces sp. NPDC059373]
MLALWDKGFDGNSFPAAVTAPRALFLGRLRSNRRTPVLARLTDGSYLSVIGTMKVRVIDAQITVTCADSTAGRCDVGGAGQRPRFPRRRGATGRQVRPARSASPVSRRPTSFSCSAMDWAWSPPRADLVLQRCDRDYACLPVRDGRSARLPAAFLVDVLSQ